ncbi:ras-related protein Rab-35-like, partial [Anneissia japonica]|uniref:ras-related protein Rab-35-like n=1 Tax=Anneissia japonica TaxID=1529436 RepID=UPI001425842C
KTSLFERFRNKDIPNSRQASLSVDRSQFSRQLAVGENSTPVVIELWDTADMERARSLTETYFRGSAAGLLVYDISRAVTLRRIPEWIRSFHFRVENAPIFLVGNKLDLEAEEYSSGETTIEHAQEILGKNLPGITRVYEVSAKKDIAVEKMFHKVAEHLFIMYNSQNYMRTEVDGSGDVIRLHYRKSWHDNVAIHADTSSGQLQKKSNIKCCKI